MSVGTDCGRTGHRSPSASRARKSVHSSRWAARLRAFALICVLALVPIALVTWTTFWINHKNHPSDEDLTEQFFTHKAEFGELVALLSADRQALVSTGSDVVDLATLLKVNPEARANTYRDLLRRLSVADLRYVLASGNLTLLPIGGSTRIEAASRTYLHLPQGQPEPVIQHHSYNNWRGPGVYFRTGDQPLENRWLEQPTRLQFCW